MAGEAWKGGSEKGAEQRARGQVWLWTRAEEARPCRGTGTQKVRRCQRRQEDTRPRGPCSVVSLLLPPLTPRHHREHGHQGRGGGHLG